MYSFDMNTNVIPLYRGLRATLVAEIAGGKFPIGSRFSTDQELCDRFQVSRHTVREALRSLQDEGLLVRQPGSGTVVGALPGSPRYVQAIDSVEQLYSTARTAKLAIRHIGWVRLGSDLAVRLDQPEGERWLRVSGLRTIGDAPRPQSWVEVYIAERYGAIRSEISGDQPIHQAIERRFNQEILAVEMRLAAVALSAGHAHLLGAEPGSPGLQILRRYLTDRDEPIELSLGVQPGSLQSQTMRFHKISKAAERTAASAILPGSAEGST